MQYVSNISLPVLPNWLESVRLNVGFPVVRTDGRAVYGYVITKFSGITHGAPQARFARQSSAMKGAGMLVVSLRGVNFRFWSRLGCCGQNTIIFSR